MKKTILVFVLMTLFLVSCQEDNDQDMVKTFTVSNISFNMLPIAGGEFTMGASLDEDELDYTEDDELPVHNVTVSDFYIGEIEVTQSLWEVVMGSNPSSHVGKNFPVENVSWEDCQLFINKLNEILSSKLEGNKFSLPTEAEWEYAARGGQKSLGFRYSGSNNVNEIAWYKDNSFNSTQPTAQKKANELGLYDMIGNVSEWCLDWYDYDYYKNSPSVNPYGPSKGDKRVVRGSCWDYRAKSCRLSFRWMLEPNSFDSYTGFRLALH